MLRLASQAEIDERGRLLATALAEGSRYGVMSGNTGALEQTVVRLFQADEGVVLIRVMDGRRRSLLEKGALADEPSLQRFEAPIRAGALDVNLFDTTRMDGTPSLLTKSARCWSASSKC